MYLQEIIKVTLLKRQRAPGAQKPEPPSFLFISLVIPSAEVVTLNSYFQGLNSES